MPPFIDFVNRNGCREVHKFVFITSEKYEYGLNENHGVEFLHTDLDINVKLESYMAGSSKIFLHGLWREKVNKILCEHNDYLQKCYWVMWGADFYYPDRYSREQLFVMKKIPYMINILDEEIALVRDLYGAEGKHIRSFFYTTNIFKPNRQMCKYNGVARVLLGHSSVRDLRHVFYLEKIKEIDDGTLEIYCPLSYPKAEADYLNSVVSSGCSLFGDRFKPLLEFIPLNEYRNWLTGICFSVFPSFRQHGMSNMIDLIGHGSKLFLDRKVSTWSFFTRIGVTIYPLDELDFSPIEESIALKNSDIIKNYFSEKRLVRDLAQIFSMDVGKNLQLEAI